MKTAARPEISLLTITPDVWATNYPYDDASGWTREPPRAEANFSPEFFFSAVKFKPDLEAPKSIQNKAGVPLQLTKLFRFYPLPLIAAIGLIAGAIAIFVMGRPDLARLAWYGTLVFGGAPVVFRTIQGMLRGKFAADIVAMLAIVTAIITDEAFAGVIIVLMQTGGEALDDYGFRRARSSLDALLARAPRIAHRRVDESVEEIDVREVRVGDRLIVRQGDLIPVDGLVTGVHVEIDESALTGEPIPRSKTYGDNLLSGSINVGEAFEMRAGKVSGDSQYSRIVELVRRAQEEKPPIQRLADRYAVWFTPVTLAMAGFGWLVTQNVDTVLAVLVVATPCPLILATPLAVISGINRAAKESIIVKGGAAIEQVARGRAVIFDKTGTLTFGTPLVETIIPIDGESDVLFRKAASVEQFSSHPVARSMVKEGIERFGKLAAPTNFRETPGQGVEADLDGEHLIIGSQRFCETTTGASLGESADQVLKQLQVEGKLMSFIICDGKPRGVIVFNDQLRPGVPGMILKLRELGVDETLMLTGDNRSNASTIARQAGIGKVEANLLPAQKVDEISRLNREYGSTIMVGDGINDAPALATATVGIAMGAHGTGISAEAADIVLLVDDVTKVCDSIAIGQRMLHIARQSIFFGLGASFSLMIIASLGLIQPAAGAIIQEGLDVTVILNALRAR